MFKVNIFQLGISFTILTFTLSLPQENADYGDYSISNGNNPIDPCSDWKQGDKDMNVLDAYTRNRFQESRHVHLESVTQVQGPTAYHVAYHIEERMNMTIETVQAFPNGVPYMFSFETTFRSSVQYTQPWYLFVIYSEYSEQEISVVINPIYQAVELSIPQSDGGLQRVYFREESIFDERWHKLMFGLTDDFVRLWVDCKELTSTTGMEKGQLNQRGEISSDGYFSIGQDVTTGQTVVVELQGMRVSCDVEKPTRTTCEELPKYEVLPSGPEERNRGDIPIDNATHPPIPDQRGQCPVQCPRGPPGYNGTHGQPGPPGQPGSPGLNAFSPYEGGGIKGEKGERGDDGFGYPGPQGPPGIPGASLNYPQPRIFNGTKGDKGERGDEGIQGERGYIGPPGLPGAPGAIHYEGASRASGEEYYQPGAPGIPGAPGTAGDRGVKGERGDTGLTGTTGLPGLNGIPGFKGDKGHTGEQGHEGKLGNQGMRGEMGYPGPQGPKGDRGAEGQCTCQEQSGSLIVGPRGPQGFPGTPGNDGIAGIPGAPGHRGPPGSPGESSKIPNELNLDNKQIRDICLEAVKEYLAEMSSRLVGPPGAPGKTRIGKPGPRGPVGSAGEPGQRGPTGERGYQGMPGIPGGRGEVGPPGKNGLNGERGEKGDTGTGTHGNPGPRGYPGVPGRDGYPGPTGERGEAGRAGDEGPRGPPGQAGECPDCSAYSAYAAYPYMYQGNSKGPANSEKG